jgi:para-nitrobenzyl esterase
MRTDARPGNTLRSRRRATAFAYLALLSFLALSAPPTGASPSEPRQDPGTATRRAQTREGPVLGSVAEGVASWKGLPFAAPPLGRLRWMAPQPALPRSAQLEAFQLGPRCPQDDRGAIGPGAGPTGEEDCLQLNIWAPAEAEAGSRLPVMLWIHGGGMVQGSGTEALYDGAALALGQSVVVVTTNYRLGALGFLAHPAFVGKDPAQPAAGNYGLLDQQAALRWLRDNIEAFGGDPERLMIFGESAGGVSVCAQMASPLTRGLFSAAAMQSGNCLTDGIAALDETRGRLAPAFEQGQRFAEAAGCADATDPAACLRALPLETIMATLPGEVGVLNPGAETYGPVIDGQVLLEAPGEAIRAGRAARLPFIAGATADEGSIFVPQQAMTYPAFAAMARSLYGRRADEILALYPASEYASGGLALAAVTADTGFVCPARRSLRDHAARGNPAWLYHFTRVPAYAASAGLGAHHGVEIGYIFDSFGMAIRRSMTAADRAIVARMQADWASLARIGKPQEVLRPFWTSIGASPDQGLNLGDEIRLETGWRDQRCHLWDDIAGWVPLPSTDPGGSIFLPRLTRP